MNDTSIRRRVERLERIFSQKPLRSPRPDFAAAFAEPDRAAEFLLTGWRVAQINATTSERLGFPPPEAFALQPAPASTAVEDWLVYRQLVWGDLLSSLSTDSPDCDQYQGALVAG